jgi:hypothetical protein
MSDPVVLITGGLTGIGRAAAVWSSATCANWRPLWRSWSKLSEIGNVTAGRATEFHLKKI